MVRNFDEPTRVTWRTAIKNSDELIDSLMDDIIDLKEEIKAAKVKLLEYQKIFEAGRVK